MKSLLERFTKWFNRAHSRSGTLWEDRFKSVIVESGTAARKLRCSGRAAAGVLWSARDLQVRLE